MIDQTNEINAALAASTDGVSIFGTARGTDVATLLGVGQVDKETVQRVRAGEYRIVYVTEKYLFRPEGCEWFVELHRQGRLLLLAVDEAQCVIECGERYDYRPDYARLGELRKIIAQSAHEAPPVPMLALSAPATPSMWTQIEAKLGLVDPVESRASIYRPNLALRCIEKPKLIKDQVLPLVREILEELRNGEEPGQTIIYTWKIGYAEKSYNQKNGSSYHRRDGAKGIRDQLEELLYQADAEVLCSCPLIFSRRPPPSAHACPLPLARPLSTLKSASTTVYSCQSATTTRPTLPSPSERRWSRKRR